jgi:hypothetical protein
MYNTIRGFYVGTPINKGEIVYSTPEGHISNKKLGNPIGIILESVVDIDQTRFAYMGPVIGSAVNVAYDGEVPMLNNTAKLICLGQELYYNLDSYRLNRTKRKNNIYVGRALGRAEVGQYFKLRLRLY